MPKSWWRKHYGHLKMEHIEAMIAIVNEVLGAATRGDSEDHGVTNA